MMEVRMPKRWTIKELEEISDRTFLLELLRERADSCTNQYAPLPRKLEHLDAKLRVAVAFDSHGMLTDGKEHVKLLPGDAGWECPCGNTSDKSGFMPSDSAGNFTPLDPDSGETGWGSEYGTCERCGRIVSEKTLEVVGRNEEAVLKIAQRTKWPQLRADAPAVPGGVKPRRGVYVGCGIAACADCYEPDDGK
jgi:hypothetical protein